MQADNGGTGDQLRHALDALCAAAVVGDQEQWDIARTAFNNADEPHFTNPCLENAARALLKRALAWHEANPSGRPTVRFPVAADVTECGKSAVSPDDEPSEQQNEEPSESDSSSQEPTPPASDSSATSASPPD